MDGDQRLTDHDWQQGPPHPVFRELLQGCPVHRTPEIPGFPEEEGFWSLTRPEDLREVSRRWQDFSSEQGGIVMLDGVLPPELQRAMFIAMDPPRHDRIKALFQEAFHPRHIATQEPMVRGIVREVLERLGSRREFDLMAEVGQPVVTRVICRLLDLPPEDDQQWARLVHAVMQIGDPEQAQQAMQQDLPQLLQRTRDLIQQRRAQPGQGLLDLLIAAEVDGERLTDDEIVMGFFLLQAAGNDSTRSVYASAMLALVQHPDQLQLLLEDPALIPGAVEEALRMFPAFSHFRRTATRDLEFNGQQVRSGDKLLLWYVASGRDPQLYPEPDRFQVQRQPQHQAFGAGGRHFCLGAALARLELRVLLEETLARYPQLELTEPPRWVSSAWINQLQSLQVRVP